MISKDTQEMLLKKIKTGRDSRIFADSSSGCMRDGGSGYVDVEPYYVDPEDNSWRNLQVKVKNSDWMLPTRPCSLADYSETGLSTLDLRCPRKPSKFLEEYYGKSWKDVPYNKYVEASSGKDGQWVKDANAPSLGEFL